MATTPTPENPLRTTSRMLFGQSALPSLKVIQGIILEESREELQFPRCIRTFDKMLLDANVASGVNIFKMMISRVKWSVEAPIDAPEEEKKRADLLNRNLYDLERPWEEYINEMCSSLEYGFVPLEKVFEPKTYNGESFAGWRDFPVISPNSIDKWYFDDKYGTLDGLKQNVSGLQDLNGKSILDQKKEIPRKKFLLFRHNPKRDNPEGNSPLKTCWLTWKYLSLIEELEVIGATKDLSGIAEYGVPQEIMQTAWEDPASWAAEFMANLEKQAAGITNGDQSYIIKPIAFADERNTQQLYTFELKGVQGSGKSSKTDEIITRHSNKILMAFFADVLKLGTQSHGSFALADSKTTILSMAIEAILMNFQRTLNHDLIKQTYRLNKWEYDPLTCARFKFDDLEKQDLDVLSSFIQRTFAVGALRPTEDIESYLREKAMGLESVEKSGTEVLETENTSRSGDGMTSGLGSGVGDSTSKGGDRSIGNKSNK